MCVLAVHRWRPNMYVCGSCASVHVYTSCPSPMLSVSLCASVCEHMYACMCLSLCVPARSLVPVWARGCLHTRPHPRVHVCSEECVQRWPWPHLCALDQRALLGFVQVRGKGRRRKSAASLASLSPVQLFSRAPSLERAGGERAPGRGGGAGRAQRRGERLAG